MGTEFIFEMVLRLIAGLALFLYGMHAMGEGLSKLSGGKMESILERLTSIRILAVLLGAGVTAVIQSSSATTVMVVGFVNSGIMKLGQAVGIIMGANIGTTMTSWLLSLTQMDGEGFLMQMLKPTSFCALLALIGVLLIMTAKDNTRRNDIGLILIGFSILIFGMNMMSAAVKPLGEEEWFRNILTQFSNPILGMLAGAVLTAILQSSSASVGILQALCATGAINFGSAIPIIMGQNIGTCVTAIISAFGASKNAKRAAMIHLYFNLIGTLIFMAVFYTLNFFIDFKFLGDQVSATHIAIVHTCFNVGCTLLWFPFAKVLVKLAELTIRDKADEKEDANEFALLDERFLEQPAFAVEMCRKVAIQMAEVSRNAFYLSLDSIGNYSEEKEKRVRDMEMEVDRYEDALGSYLVKLNNRDLTDADGRSISVMLHCINDFERISDHAVNIVESAKEMHDKKLEFSDNAWKEFEVFANAVREIIDTSVDSYVHSNLDNAKMVEPLEQVIDGLNAELKQRHIKRLRKGKCTIELGWVLQDLLTNIERVADHCSNIAVGIIEIKKNEFETHSYMGALKQANENWFTDAVYTLRDKYALPEGAINEEAEAMGVIVKQEIK